ARIATPPTSQPFAIRSGVPASAKTRLSSAPCASRPRGRGLMSGVTRRTPRTGGCGRSVGNVEFVLAADAVEGRELHAPHHAADAARDRRPGLAVDARLRDASV